MVTAACGGSTASSPSPSPVDIGSGSIVADGATFPKPFYDQADFDYNAKYPQVKISYNGGGSGQGIKDFIANTVDFAGSDVPMSSADITSAGGADTLTQIPATLGVVAIAYNVTGLDKLQLDGPTLANIFLGHIAKWNDHAIAGLNAGVTLPNKSITVFHRADGSGTTFHFTDYLSKVSDEWKSKVGTAKQPSWPAGQSASGNQGVAQGISTTDGAIGYVELAYVVSTGMHQAYLKNANGKFLQASVEGATAAAGTNSSVGPTNFSITNAPCDACYPIAAFSWLIVRTSYSDASKGRAIVYFLK
jgi:phosphate transport system substrate-binding protein